MGINTGDLTHIIRQEALPKGSLGYKAGDFVANHFAGVKSALRPVLSLANFGHSLLGTKAMSGITKGLHNALGIPLWTPAMPKSYQLQATELQATSTMQHNSAALVARSSVTRNYKVVYFPSCINQTMGLAKKSPVEQPLVNKMVSLLQKAGYEIIFPKDMDKLCCGTIWEVKGCWTLPIARQPNWRPHFGKPANKANTPSSVTKALVCTACANVSRR